jgi:D-arabinose 1-dehydrogenase-like Zn-dependent alcohol dehydrogenase
LISATRWLRFAKPRCRDSKPTQAPPRLRASVLRAGRRNRRIKVHACGICHNEVYPLERAAEAYERMVSGKALFRVVLKIGE